MTSPRWDLAVVGAGIVGLAHAVAAVEHGLRVVVLDRDERATGASVRNFGHACVTAQAGVALDYALAARETWLRLSTVAGFWLRDAGAVLVARAEDELAVLDEFAAARDGQVRILGAAAVADRVPAGPDVLGGAFFPLDLRVDPRAAVPAIAAWLTREHGVEFRWRTAVTALEPGVVRTSRGELAADRVVVAVGHDLDQLLPEPADAVRLQRCALHMLQVTPPAPVTVDPAVLSGLSLLRYAGFAGCPSLPAVRDRIRACRPELLDADVNLMYTQRPDGDLVIGDTHAYGRSVDPFRAEELDRLLLTETAALLGLPGPGALAVRHRWRGVYAWSPDVDFLATTVHTGLRVATVATGIGMTTAFGFAAAVVADLLAPDSAAMQP